MKILTLPHTKKLSLVTLVTNYHKLSLAASFYSFYHLRSGIDVKFLILLFLLQISYIFKASTKALNLLQIGTEN